MIKKIKNSLLIKNIKLTQKYKNAKEEIEIQKEEINKLKEKIKKLKDLNYDISSNYDYLVQQRRRTNRKIREIRRENNELKNRLEEEK